MRGDSDKQKKSTQSNTSNSQKPETKKKTETPITDKTESLSNTKKEESSTKTQVETPETSEIKEPVKKPVVEEEPVKEQVIEEKPKTIEKKEPSVYSKIILYGPNNSHKTQLFYSLLLNKNPLTFQTVTSITPNISESFKFNNKITTLVDIPGHSNFESKIGNHLEKNSLLLFVFKTQSEQNNYLGKTAHKLYEILTKHDLISLNITLGLLAIKNENFGDTEEENDFIKEFEKEIERIKFSRRTHVNVEEGSGAAGDYLKDIKENFVLDHIRAKRCQCLFLKLDNDSIQDFVNLI